MLFAGIKREACITHEGMGTRMSHRAFGLRARGALRAVRAEAKRLERLLSRFRPESDIGRLNRSAGLEWQTLSRDAFDALSAAKRFSRLSQGLFDATVCPLADLWDCLHATEAPDDAGIRRLLPLADHESLLLNPNTGSARLEKRGQRVDLGGIGKGYAADRFIRIFKEFGCASAYTNVGGDVCLLGGRPDGAPWSVGIRHPRQEGRLLGAVSARNGAVVTSGDYERCFFTRDGRRFHHILDPATGYPADAGLISVTVAAASATAADALSTAVFVAGLEKGMMLLRAYGEADAILVDRDLTVLVTEGLADRFKAAEGVRCAALR